MLQSFSAIGIAKVSVDYYSISVLYSLYHSVILS